MKRIALVLLFIAAISADAATVSGELEFRLRSRISDSSSLGQTADLIEYAWPVEVVSPTQVYHADRTIAPSASVTLGLVGSLTNALGQTITLATVQGLYLQNLGTSTLTISGLASMTIPSLGVICLSGDYGVASHGSTIAISTTATTTTRIWIVGK